MTDEQQSITFAFPRMMISNSRVLGRVWRLKEGVAGFQGSRMERPWPPLFLRLRTCTSKLVAACNVRVQ